MPFGVQVQVLSRAPRRFTASSEAFLVGTYYFALQFNSFVGVKMSAFLIFPRFTT